MGGMLLSRSVTAAPSPSGNSLIAWPDALCRAWDHPGAARPHAHILAILSERSKPSVRLPLRFVALHRACLPLLLLAASAGCAPEIRPIGPSLVAPVQGNSAFIMPDGAGLPYQAWLPEGPPSRVLLALHGFGDTARNAFQRPAPQFAAAGIAVYAYDQRGFGGAPHRGIWAGNEALKQDLATVVELLQQRHPGVPIFVMGESMGGAVALAAGAAGLLPQIAGTVLVAPAVMGRASMNWLGRATLGLAAHTIPLMSFQNAGSGIRPTDDDESLRAWGRDPLTLKEVRVDAVIGLVGLMDEATAGAPGYRAPLLVLQGARDDIIKPDAVRRMLLSLPHAPGQRFAYYPEGYHMLLRDRRRDAVIQDIIGWIQDPSAPLSSGAEAAAAHWLTPTKP